MYGISDRSQYLPRMGTRRLECQGAHSTSVMHTCMTYTERICRDKEAWFESLVGKAHAVELERRLAGEEAQHQKLERRAKIRAKAAVRLYMHVCCSRVTPEW